MSVKFAVNTLQTSSQKLNISVNACNCDRLHDNKVEIGNQRNVQYRGIFTTVFYRKEL
jgi:hypothetical protein